MKKKEITKRKERRGWGKSEGYMEMMNLGEGEAQRRDAGGVQRDTRPKD